MTKLLSPHPWIQSFHHRRNEAAQAWSLPLVNPQWMFPITFLSFKCLEVPFGRICSIPFPLRQGWPACSSLEQLLLSRAELKVIHYPLSAKFYYTETFLPFPLHWVELVSPQHWKHTLFAERSGKQGHLVINIFIFIYTENNSSSCLPTKLKGNLHRVECSIYLHWMQYTLYKHGYFKCLFTFQ